MKTQKRALGLAFAIVWTGSSAGAAQMPASPESSRPRHSWFVVQSARASGLFEHLHASLHSEVGVRIAWLKIGIAGAFRPAPWTRHRQRYALPIDRTYKGQSSLDLGLQYGWFGVMVSPIVPLGRQSHFSLELPITVGPGFVGTPLLGDDRDTPDGRRVSAWENELLDERDVSVGLVLDVGARARVQLASDLGVFLGLGLHYSAFFGITTLAVEGTRTHGLSGSLALIVEP